MVSLLVARFPAYLHNAILSAPAPSPRPYSPTSEKRCSQKSVFSILHMMRKWIALLAHRGQAAPRRRPQHLAAWIKMHGCGWRIRGRGGRILAALVYSLV